VQKTTPTIGRMLVMAGFALSCFGLLLFLWLAFGGAIPLKPEGYRVKVPFQEATSLAPEADVTISGVRVGKVKTLDADQSGTTMSEIEIEPRYAPLPSNTRAILRQKTLLGETYVELSPGDGKGSRLADGGTLPTGQVSQTVELDEIFRAFDPKTRTAFQVWMQSLAQASQGRGQDLNDAFGLLGPFAQDTSQLLVVLNSQEGAVRRLVSDTGVVFGALTERGDQLRSLIDNSEQVFRTTARRDRQLADTFAVLPTFEKESETTVRRLQQFSNDTNPLVTQLRPAAKELSPTLQSLSALAPDLEGLFRDLNPLIDASEKGLPALQAFIDDVRPLLGQLDPWLRSLNPPLHGLSLYTKELGAFFANASTATQAVETSPGSASRVHYLRTSNPLNEENLAVYPRRIGSNRPNPYPFPGTFTTDWPDPPSPGLLVYEDRHCTRGVPTLAPASGLPTDVNALLPESLRQLLQTNVFTEAGVAPPCVRQPAFPNLGAAPTPTGQFPRLYPDAPPSVKKK
jgi:phospholipid/cholesterol/gamma-HCH transport system substrate-binding protein